MLGDLCEVLHTIAHALRFFRDIFVWRCQLVYLSGLVVKALLELQQRARKVHHGGHPRAVLCVVCSGRILVPGRRGISLETFALPVDMAPKNGSTASRHSYTGNRRIIKCLIPGSEYVILLTKTSWWPLHLNQILRIGEANQIFPSRYDRYRRHCHDHNIAIQLHDFVLLTGSEGINFFRSDRSCLNAIPPQPAKPAIINRRVNRNITTVALTLSAFRERIIPHRASGSNTLKSAAVAGSAVRSALSRQSRT